MPNNAAILAIGSELLSGQITNRNSVWISKELFNYGIATDLHLVVDDIKDKISNWIELASKECDHIFITGGLGPTSDDLTRDAIAAWAGLELEFEEESWTHVKEYSHASIGQCLRQIVSNAFFPKGPKSSPITLAPRMHSI